MTGTGARGRSCHAEGDERVHVMCEREERASARRLKYHFKKKNTEIIVKKRSIIKIYLYGKKRVIPLSDSF
jgi:hypothetical protein